MRRLAPMLAVLALVATACGDDATGPLFTTTTNGTGTTTTTTATTTGTYPQGLIDAYMGGCSPTSGDAFCRCTIREFEARLTVEDFLALNEADIGSDPVAQEIIDICLNGTTTGTTVAGGDFTPITTVDEIENATIADLQTYWSAEMPREWGIDFQPLADLGPYYVSQGDQPRCGGPMQRREYEENAFYCGADDTIQWDAEGLMAPLFQQFGDFTVALVLAHEWGHAIQNRYGFDEVNQPTIISELQADCFAGAWTGHIANDESDVLRLEPGDLEEAMAGFLLIGDGLGNAPGGPDAHGGSFDRLNAFFDGFTDGVPRCATYETDQPPIVFIDLQVGDDPSQGGDLPLAEVAPTITAALEIYWGIVYPDLFGDTWTPVSQVIPYRPSSGDLPSCGGFGADRSFYEGNAYYCPPDDYVAWDDEGLFPSLYTEVGDFAVGLVLATQWGHAVQERAGLPTDGVDAALQADCLTGTWTAALTVADNPMQLYLSAGDLEEGIAGFLTLSGTPGEEGSGAGAFDRFQAFKEGFFNGTDACGLG
ncbi:MAG TPA: neutral zinc metallopeptidase [Acidimicrobiia bacterium]|nr:neutral zinc metallopeptidase [Acidimicrobiia bacterium]